MMDKSKKRRALLLWGIAIIFIFVFFVIPLPYYSIFPGAAISMGDIVKITEGQVGSVKPHFYAISSYVYENPYSTKVGLSDNSFKVNLAVYLWASFSSDVELNSFPSGYVSSGEIKEYNYDQLIESQDNAIRLAGKHLHQDIDIDVSFGDLAGPSGSLVTALEIIQQLGDQDLIQDRKVAVTGELTADGTVDKIGNINQKVITATKHGMELLIAPKDNELDLTVPHDMEVIFVTDLEDAINKLKN